jgi:hypothetical protein
MKHAPQFIKVAARMDRSITETNGSSVRQEDIVLESWIRGTHHHLTKVDETMLHMGEICSSSVRNKCVGLGTKLTSYSSVLNNCLSLVTSYVKEHFRDLSQSVEAMDCMKGGHAQLHGKVAQLGLDPATVWRIESSPLGISGCTGERGIVGVLECHWDEFCDVIST